MKEESLLYTENYFYIDMCFLISPDSHSQATDFTAANSLRLGIGACVLLLALLFITEAWWNEKHQESWAK